MEELNKLKPERTAYQQKLDALKQAATRTYDLEKIETEVRGQVGALFHELRQSTVTRERLAQHIEKITITPEREMAIYRSAGGLVEDVLPWMVPAAPYVETANIPTGIGLMTRPMKRAPIQACLKPA